MAAVMFSLVDATGVPARGVICPLRPGCLIQYIGDWSTVDADAAAQLKYVAVLAVLALLVTREQRTPRSTAA